MRRNSGGWIYWTSDVKRVLKDFIMQVLQLCGSVVMRCHMPHTARRKPLLIILSNFVYL